MCTGWDQCRCPCWHDSTWCVKWDGGGPVSTGGGPWHHTGSYSHAGRSQLRNHAAETQRYGG